MTRTFDDSPAVREATPLLVGIVGSSSSGKTFSALRLATGIQRVTGGEIFGIDSEANRMKHYAPHAGEAPRHGLFNFRHVPFRPPFSPTDYLAAIEHCVKKGAKVIVIDSYSHVHEGVGGLLEMHDSEVKRLLPTFGTEAKASIPAWARPKAEHRRVVNLLLQMSCHFIFCFRADEKLKIVRGQDPEQMGFTAIAPRGFIYELTAKFLLMPGAAGHPSWSSTLRGEQMLMKRPEQFRAMFDQHKQLSEDLGEAMAKWAAGAEKPPAHPVDIDALLARYATADRAGFDALEVERKAAWGQASAEQKKNLKLVSDATRERLAGAEAAPAAEPTETAPVI